MDVVPERQLEEGEEGLRRSRRSSAARFLRRLILLALVVLITPYLLILLYAPPVVHPISTLMLADLALLKGYDRRWMALEDMSPNLVRSVMMSEDGQFCRHAGVDWGEMKAVVQEALEGEATRGASTIPMQAAKNLFLWNGRSFVRKALELPLAIAADFVWSKHRLMEIYLNIVEWGPGIYGAEAAARYHFGVSASDLSRKQAALLAVALPNPITRVAGKPGRGMQRLAGVVERRARSSGDYITCIYR